MRPRARNTRLVVREVGDELLVYDKVSKLTHRLNPAARLVWQSCDGNRSNADLAALLSSSAGLPESESIVELALQDLSKANLLVEPAQPREAGEKISRRSFARRFALTAGFAALLPAVESILLPESASAAGGRNCMDPRGHFGIAVGFGPTDDAACRAAIAAIPAFAANVCDFNNDCTNNEYQLHLCIPTRWWRTDRCFPRQVRPKPDEWWACDCPFKTRCRCI